jgi:hypothetical protein
MDKYRLKDKDLDREIRDRHLDRIAQSYCREWRRLPTYLGLDKIVVTNIERGYGQGNNEDDKKRDFFSEWKQRRGSRATYRQLIYALLEIGCEEDAEGVCVVLQNLSQLQV